MRKKKLTDNRRQFFIRYRIDDKGRIFFIDPCCDEIPALLFGKIIEAISNVEKEWNSRMGNKASSLLPDITLDEPILK